MEVGERLIPQRRFTWHFQLTTIKRIHVKYLEGLEFDNR
jgi:hypothetical protein